MDSDDGAKDSGGAGCSEYLPGYCGKWDDGDFTSGVLPPAQGWDEQPSAMCCICGGGRMVYPPPPGMIPAPAS